MNPIELLKDLKTKGGAIVCSGDCTETEIAVAATCNRLAVDQDGFGFVRRRYEWLAINKNREIAHPNTDGRFNPQDTDPKAREGG